MAEKIYIQWNLVNWITITLMVFVGLAVVGMIASAVRHYNGNSAQAVTTD